MRINFAQSYSESFTTIISKRGAERVVNNPDKIDSIETEEGQPRIVTRSKLVQDQELGAHFFVVTSIDDQDVVTVTGGFRIRTDVAENSDSLSPVQLLKSLAKQVGEHLIVGDSPTTFIDHEEIQVRRMDFNDLIRILGVPMTEGQPWVILGAARFRKYDGGYIAELQNFFCVNRLKYLKWWQEAQSSTGM